MMAAAILLFSLFLIDLTTSQIPNPNQYRFTLTINGTARERYAIDQPAGKMSRLWFSNIGNEQFGGNQFIYDDDHTYFFNFMMQPSQCTANPGGPPKETNYWPNLVQSFGGEQKKYDELIFDSVCDGTCLTWVHEYNDTGYLNQRVVDRLYVEKAEQKPIKMITKGYDLKTGNLVSTTLTEFTNWITGKVPDYEYDYPMKAETCFPI